MGNFFTNPFYPAEDTGVICVRRRVTLGQNGLAAGTVPIGAAQKGALIVRAYAVIHTVFNAATTNFLTLGDSGDDDSLVTSTNAAAGALGIKAGSGVKVGTELTADTVFYGKFTQSGTAATTGDATLIVEFINPRNWSDNAGAQAT